MAYGVSNGHVTDVVTWPRKGKLVTPILLELSMSKTVGTDISQVAILDSLLWGSMVGYPSNSLASCSIYKNLIHSFILRYPTFIKKR